MVSTPPENITITLEDVPNLHETRPLTVRLQTLLKLMQKGFGLQCVSIRPVDSIPPNTQSPSKEAGS